MKYNTSLDTVRFYPHRYWFYHFVKFTNISGFKIRIMGIELMIKEENSLSKLIKLAHLQNAARTKKIMTWTY